MAAFAPCFHPLEGAPALYRLLPPVYFQPRILAGACPLPLLQHFSGHINQKSLAVSESFPLDGTSQKKTFTVRREVPEYVGNIVVKYTPPSDEELLFPDTFYMYFDEHVDETQLIFFGGTVGGHTAGLINEHYFFKGADVSIYINEASDTDGLKVGLIFPDQTATYFSLSQVCYGSIKIPESGMYTLFTENTGSTAETFQGRIIY